MLYDDYMLKKYEAKKEKIQNWIRKILVSCLVLVLAFYVLWCIYDEVILLKLALSLLCIIMLFSSPVENIAIKRLKKRSDQEIQEFEQKFPIGKRVPIFVDWIKMQEDYNSLPNEVKEMFSYLNGKQQELYLLREKDLDGDSFTIECEDSKYLVYTCMSRDYDEMTKLTQRYYKTKE